MRIVHIVRQFPPGRGGLEDFVASLCREQHAAGDRPRVVTLDRIFSDPDRLLEPRECMANIPVRRIGWRGSRRYPLAPGVLRHVEHCDLIHVHAVDFFFDWLALTRPFHRRPMVATTHGGFFHTGDFAAAKRLWFHTLTRASARAYDAVVGCSVNDARIFAGVAGARVELVENGVNLDKFADAASQSPSRRIATIGRFSSNKRLDRLLDAMAVLTVRDGGWRLDIVGAASDWSEADVRAAVEARGLLSSVEVHCGIDDEAARAVIARCSLFASASMFEGFGIALLEAMSAGLVPVVHPNAAFSDFAQRRGHVHLADFSDAVQAADALEAAFAMLSAEPEAARERVRQGVAPYAWPAVAARYRDVYDRVLAAR